MMSILGGAIIGVPILTCFVLCLVWWLKISISESLVARLTNGAFFLSSLLAFLTLGSSWGHSVLLEFGEWYSMSGYEFLWRGTFDPLSLIFTGLAAFLLGVIGVFSQSYMHQERGFLRFYLLTLLFGVGVETVLLAASLDQVFFGWELVGLSSALLIAFFSHRPGPAKGGIRAFLTYRFCDIGLLAAVVVMHHSTGSTVFSSFQEGWFGLPALGSESTAILVVLLLVFACMGKSALVPFGGWLPRAMEGPTPSSAVFYGALSIHLGPYLMLRCSPIIDQSKWAGAILVTIGVLTAFHGTSVGRVQPDVKGALAYGSMTQVGLIFIEIGLGWNLLAAIHIVGHACIRTLEILRAPSVLHDYHHIETSLGAVLPKMGLHYERFLPKKWQMWFYHMSLERGFSEALLMNVMQAWKAIVGVFDGVETFIETRIMGLPSPDADKVKVLK